MEVPAPLPEAAVETGHGLEPVTAEDVRMVMDEGGDALNLQQSSHAAYAPIMFVTLPYVSLG